MKLDTDMKLDPGKGSALANLRVKLNRWIFRSMILTSGGATVALYRLGVSKSLVWRFSKLQARNLCRATGVSVTIEGGDLLERGGPYIFTPNHASHMDIAVLLGYLPGNNRFASKKELFEQPVLGMAMRTLGMLPVDRDDPMASIEVLNRAVRGGSSIVIFPEGTRSRDGNLLPFKKGPFVAAIHMGYPVVPVVVKGTRDLMPRGGYFSIQPGKVHIIVKRPIPTNGLVYEDRERLLGEVREAIRSELSLAA